MGADQINFSIRYREKNSIFDKPKREEIEKFIIDYSVESGIDAEEGTYSDHFPQYSEVTFNTCYGSIGSFCRLPEAMVENYPGIEFEFHYIEWYGNVVDNAEIYDGEQIYQRAWEVLSEAPEDDEEDEEGEEMTEAIEDPFHAPRYWIADGYSFMDPHFLYID